MAIVQAREILDCSLPANTFTVKNISGYKVEFEMDNDKPLGFTSYQPNGTFKAYIKK